MSFNVFISHSVNDLWLVQVLGNALRQNGVNPYIAVDSPEPGRLLESKIREEINKSDCVLALLTYDGSRSIQVNTEIGIAIQVGKPIIPIVESGAQLSFVLEGKEYIPFDRENPADAMNKTLNYINTLKVSKEQRDILIAAGSVIIGSLILYYLLKENH